MTKFTFKVTVDVENPNVYTIGEDGQALGPAIDVLGPHEVAGYIAEACHIWGAQFAPGDPLHPSNIRTVRVRSTLGRQKIDVSTSPPTLPEEDKSDDS